MSITENHTAGNPSLPERAALSAALPAVLGLSGIAMPAGDAQTVARTLLRLRPQAPLAAGVPATPRADRVPPGQTT